MRVLLAATLAVSSLLCTGDAQAQYWSSDYFKKSSNYVRGYSLDGCPTNNPVWDTTDAYSNVVITNIAYTTNSTNGTVTAKTNIYACGGTSIIWYVKGWTFGPSTIDQTNNQSVQFGGYNIVQSATFPGITNPSLYRPFTNPGGAVSFTADFAITRTANSVYVGKYTNWDSFGFSFLDSTGLTNLARIQFIPTPGTTNWYTLTWLGQTTNGSTYKSMTNFQRGSLYRLTATFQGNLFTVNMAGLLIETNSSGHTTNFAVSSSAAIITNATIENGLTAAHFSRASADWLLKSTNVLEAGANYMLINSMAVSNAPVATPALSAVVLSNALSGSYGSASGAVGFAAAGTNLSGGISAAAQGGFQVSTNQGSGYGSSVSVATGTTVWVRFAATKAAGTYNGATAVVLSSAGATNVNVTTSASNNAVAAAPLTITGLTAQNKEWDGTTAVNVTGTPQYAGLVNSESFPVGGSVTWAFADANVGTNKSLVRTGNYTTPSANYTVTQPSLTASIAAALPSAPSISGITAGNAALSVAFTPPLTDGGAVITNYAYSTDGGSEWSTASPAVTNTPISIANLTNGVTYSVCLRAINSAGSGPASSAAQGTPVAPLVPVISVVPSVFSGALSTTYGAPSAAQMFTVTGADLGGSLTVQAPAGLEVSTNSTRGFAGSFSLPASSGAVGPTVVYARLAATAAAGTFNNRSITISGGGAPAQSVTTTGSGNDVAPAELTVTGISVGEKVYDGTTSATIAGSPTYAGLQNAESFTVAGTPVAVFASPSAGSGKAVSVSGYAAPSANYTVVQPSLTGNITPKSLTVTGAAVATKTYDGNTTATISGAMIDGVVGQDSVSLTGATSGLFASANAGNGIAVATAMVLAGDDASNYSLVQPSLTGDIRRATQTIAFDELSEMTAGTTKVLVATATSGLPVTFASSDPAVASVASNNVLLAVSPGVAAITASQAGNGNFDAAPPISRDQSVAALPAPVITSALSATGICGVPFSYQIATATNNPADAFGAAPLPSGLSVDGQTGLISGVPAESGGFNVQISATNSGGADGKILVLTVNASFDSWAQGATLNAENLLKYAIGGASSPTAKDDIAPVSGVTSSNLWLRAIVRTNDPKLSTAGFAAGHIGLASWSSNGVTMTPGIQDGVPPGWQLQIFQSPTSGERSGFLRLRSVLQPE